MNPYPFGQCTWWCADQQPWCTTRGNLHNAKDWGANWRERGGFVQLVAAVGAIACFQPGSNGADAIFGHVAVVVKVLDAHSFIVSEMNGPAGPGHTDDRECWNDAGVSFLMAPAPPEPIMDCYLATTGTRPAGETKDPHGDGAIYLVSGPFKRWISGTEQAALPQYEALYGPVRSLAAQPFVLDHMIELAPIDATYPTLGWSRPASSG